MKLPCGDHAQLAQPEQVGAALASGSISSRNPRSPPRSSSPPSAPAREAIATSRIAPSIACETPSISFSATLPVKPSVTTTSATPVDDVAALDVADEHERRPSAAALGQPAWASSTSALPRAGLLAVGEQRHARALDAEHRVAPARRP